MELYQLRGFKTVAEHSNLTRAAERLNLSQPALSSQVKALEDELGVILFDRTPAGMQLTEAGKSLLAKTEIVLELARALMAEATALNGRVAGKVRLGTLADPQFIRIAELLGAMNGDHPLVDIEFKHMVTGEAFDAVLAGELDASFYYGERMSERILRLPLRKFAYRVAAPFAWSDQINQADWPELAALPWIIPPSISTHAELAKKLFDGHGAKPKKIVKADNEAVVSSLVVSGIGVALMREDYAIERALAREVCLWRDIRLGTRLDFICLSERSGEAPIKALLDTLKVLWNVPA